MRRTTPPPRVPEAGLVYRLLARLALAVMRLQRWEFDVEGTEHIPVSGGGVIAANHNSFWDFIAVGLTPYVELGRPIRILGKKSLFEIPVIGVLLKRTGCIPVDRGDGHEALTRAISALESGELVLVLPEGTISRSFDLLSFRNGAARMAAAANVPLIPAASWGTQRFATSGHPPRWRWRLPVVIRYGAPLTPAADDSTDDVTDRLRSNIQVVLDAAIHAYPDGAPAGAWWVPERLGGGAPRHGDVEHQALRTRTRWRQRRRR